MRTSAPEPTAPLQIVPVTTVPTPRTVNTRSTGSRKRSSSRRARTRCAAALSALWSSSRPFRSRADTGITGQSFGPNTRSNSSRTIWHVSPIHSSSTVSDLVTAATPCSTPRSRAIHRCSRVCGIGPSSAATVRRSRSTPLAPASMFFTKSSWPGTSITEMLSSSESLGKRAKPRSIVIPRSRSSTHRSVLIPVSASTRVVFPWSTWPAVPRIADFIRNGLPENEMSSAAAGRRGGRR